MTECVPELIASLAGRLPQEVEEGLRQQVASYEANFKSVMCKFPTSTIDQVVFDYLRVRWWLHVPTVLTVLDR
jgi:hypothetical protein